MELKETNNFITYRNYGYGVLNNSVLSYIIGWGDKGTYASNLHLSGEIGCVVKSITRALSFLEKENEITILNPNGKSRFILCVEKEREVFGRTISPSTETISPTTQTNSPTTETNSPTQPRHSVPPTETISPSTETSCPSTETNSPTNQDNMSHNNIDILLEDNIDDNIVHNIVHNIDIILVDFTWKIQDYYEAWKSNKRTFIEDKEITETNVNEVV